MNCKISKKYLFLTDIVVKMSIKFPLIAEKIDKKRYLNRQT